MLLEFGSEQNQNNLLVDSSLKLTSSPATSPFGASQSPLIDTAIQQLELKLQQLAIDSELTDKMDQAFGNNWDIQKAQSLTQDWLTGEFKGIPDIKIVSQADINGANGAFANAIDTIYLSREFLTQNTANPEAVVDILLEETGHFIDSVVNSTDTAGDEGERFATVVQGKTLTPAELAAIQTEDDTATVVIDGQTLVIEKAANTVSLTTPDASAAEVLSGQTANPGLFTVTRTGSTTNALTVNYDVAGRATKGTDYNNLTGSVTIPIGATTANIPITVIDDTAFEGSETVVVALSTSTAYDLGTVQAGTVIIADNDKPTVTLATPDASAAEVLSGQTANPGQFTVTRTGSTTSALTVNYTVAGTATKGTDYSNLTGIVTIPIGATTANIPITVIDDTSIEGSETAIVNLSTATTYDLGTAKTGTVTIADNDKPTVTVSTPDASAAEILSGQTANPGRFTVTRTGITTNALTVNYTVAGTATKGTDYSNLTGSVTIPIGATTANIPINVIDDTTFEGSETAIVNLSTATTYDLGTAKTGTVTIADNDKPTVTVSTPDASAAEILSGQTANPGQFTITRTGSTTNALTVNYTVAGTATKGTDYNNLTGSVTIPIGATTANIPITVIDDSAFEGSETAIVNLSTATTYNLGTAKTGTVTIADNDKPTVTVSTPDASAAEILSGQTANPGRFTVTRTGITTNALTVNYTVAGTATKETDYNNLTGSVTIPIGATTANIPITVIDDTLVEGSETAIVNLSTATTYNLGTTKTGTVTIADNDKTGKTNTDVDGDGRDDAIVSIDSGIVVRRSDGTKFLPNELWTDIGYAGKYGTWFADVTGDGKADAIVSIDSCIVVRRSDGTKFLPNEQWTDISFVGAKGTWFADVTGDGKADAIASNEDGVYIRRSDGTKFLPSEKWTDIGYGGTEGTWFADVTGDGKADAIGANRNDGVYIRRSDGTKFLPNEKWTDIGFAGTKGTWIADVTGDGKADAIASNGDGIYIRRSDGTKFLPNEKWTDIGYGGNEGSFFGDVTGDGKTDAIVGNGGGFGVGAITVRRSDSTKFLPNEKWTDIGYGGNRGTFIGTTAINFDDPVDVNQQWKSTIYFWDNQIGTPSTDLGGDLNYNPNAIGVINLGSNTRSDGKKGINANWGSGLPSNLPDARLPYNFLAMRAYTSADFDGSAYKFRVRGDDGFYISAKNHTTGQWFNITPQNQWQYAYGNASEINATLPAGRYDVVFHLFEGGGDSYIDLSWEKVNTGYYSELGSLSETQWDQQSGDDNQFRSDSPYGGGDQRWKTDDRIEQIYTDLSNTIFGYRVHMNTGYAYDQSYYSGYGTWHAGLDMGASNGATIKAAIGGTVAWTSGSGDGYVFVGINSDDGRQWVYGHLKSSSGLWNGKRINAGETVGIVGALNHLHLEVENGHAYGGTQGAMANQSTLLNVTVSPLMAYWQWRN